MLHFNFSDGLIKRVDLSMKLVNICPDMAYSAWGENNQVAPVATS